MNHFAAGALGMMLLASASPLRAGTGAPWDLSPADRALGESPGAEAARVLAEETNPARLVGLLAIRLYQVTLGRIFSPRCQFHPSCSRYAFRAVASRGLVNGTVMAGERLLRCHRFAVLYSYPSHLPEGLLSDPPGGKPSPLPPLTWLGF